MQLTCRMFHSRSMSSQIYFLIDAETAAIEPVFFLGEINGEFIRKYHALLLIITIDKEFISSIEFHQRYL